VERINRWKSSPQSRKLLAETMCAVGLVFAAFGAYLLWETKASVPSDGRLARLLLKFFDPMTASLIASYASLGFGIALTLLGLHLLLKARR
jgi:uncharacterized iron-regulated membrane protein